VVVNEYSEFKGIIQLADIYSEIYNGASIIECVSKTSNAAVKSSDTLRSAVELMAQQAVELLPVLENNKVIGVLTYSNIISSYKQNFDENETAITHISLKRQRMKIVLKGKSLFKKS